MSDWDREGHSDMKSIILWIVDNYKNAKYHYSLCVRDTSKKRMRREINE